MKICLISEGAYPYVVGGVSSWVNNLMHAFPEYEFILLSVISDKSYSKKWVYKLPDNLLEIHEVCLNGLDIGRKSVRLSADVYDTFRGFLLDQDVDLDLIFDFFMKNRRLSLNDLLMGVDFFHMVLDCYDLKYDQLVFSDFLWNMRSIYLPMLRILSTHIPEADIYHVLSTGYAGLLGCMAKYFYHKPLLLSEHGIYTREREEELIKAKWVKDIYKDIWIKQFYKMSSLCYDRADLVISLYEQARELEVELGCDPNKTKIIPNGIRMSDFDGLNDHKDINEKDLIFIGAVLRVVPIKDVKTMIRAFLLAKQRVPNLRLYIMGPWDEDPEYAQECFDFLDHDPDIVFTGKVDVKEYLGRMDIMILTSISEGQPLTILESFSAKKPVIATDVGNCRGLIEGEDDDIYSAGIVTRVMDVKGVADAIVILANNKVLRERMGNVGYDRVAQKYRYEMMIDQYREVYESCT